MDTQPESFDRGGNGDAREMPWDVALPKVQTLPMVFASPHSGTDYLPEFLKSSRLDPLTLRKSEDSFVDEIFAAAPSHGAPLLSARFPRAYVDPNREPFELDPDMFEDALPDYINTNSPRVAAGLGTIARVVCSGAEIYKRKLTLSEALRRINVYYRPYHDALRSLVDKTRERFGLCILIDCHSMPSIGGPMDRDPGRKRVDFVLGDCHGASCDDALTDLVHEVLVGQGYVVRRNLPYAGGFTTRHYSDPSNRLHTLQIEVNRAIYMDENNFERRDALATLASDMSDLIATLKRRLDLDALAA